MTFTSINNEYILVDNTLYKKNNDEYILFASCDPSKFRPNKITANLDWMIKINNKSHIKLNDKFILFDKIVHSRDKTLDKIYLFCRYNQYCLVCKKNDNDDTAVLHKTGNKNKNTFITIPTNIISISNFATDFLIHTKSNTYSVKYEKQKYVVEPLYKCIKCVKHVDPKYKCSRIGCSSFNVSIKCDKIKLHTINSQKSNQCVVINVDALYNSIINSVYLEQYKSKHINKLFNCSKQSTYYYCLTYSGDLYYRYNNNNNKIATNIKSFGECGANYDFAESNDGKLFVIMDHNIREFILSDEIERYNFNDCVLSIYATNNLIYFVNISSLINYTYITQSNIISIDGLKMHNGYQKIQTYDRTNITSIYGDIKLTLQACSHFMLFTNNGYVIDLHNTVHCKYDPNNFIGAYLKYTNKSAIYHNKLNDNFIELLIIVCKNKISVMNTYCNQIYDFDMNQQIIKCNNKYIFPKINIYDPVNIYHICDNYKYLCKTMQKQIFTFLCVLKKYVNMPKPLICIILGLLLN